MQLKTSLTGTGITKTIPPEKERETSNEPEVSNENGGTRIQICPKGLFI